MRLLFTYVLLCCSCRGVVAQGSYPLRAKPDSVVSLAGLKVSFSSQQMAEQYVANLVGQLQAKGYWSAALSDVIFDSSGGRLHLFLGAKYRWAALPLPLQYAGLLGQAHKPNSQRQSGANPAIVQQKLLDYFCNTGHPFATVALDSIRLSGDLLTGQWVIDPGLPYKFDSIQVSGGLKLKSAYLYRYLQLQPGMPFNAGLLGPIDSRLAELNFAEPLQPFALSMLATGATAQLYLKARRSNVINVLLGIMPASTQTPDAKLQITGDANILLRNAFANGESIGINWQQIQYRSPRINLSFQQPYLFGSSLGADLAFDLLKKDTQFLSINFKVGVPYQLKRRAVAKVFFQQFATTVSTADTLLVLQTRRLPILANISSSNVGLDFSWQSTDYDLNPRHGWQIATSAMAGLKRLKQDANIAALQDPADPNFNFGNLYDSVQQNSYQLRLKATAARYQPIGNQGVVKLGLQGGWLQTPNYFRNELFQIGGFKLLRGFDEESIFASGYLVATAEYRLLAGRNGYFFGFVDAGWAQYTDELVQLAHGYFGSGLGLNIDTKNSLINLSWAIGKRSDLPFSLRQSKIHLGVVNYF